MLRRNKRAERKRRKRRKKLDINDKSESLSK